MGVIKVLRRARASIAQSIRLKFIGIDVSTGKKERKKKQKRDTKGTDNYRFRSVRHTGSFYSYSLHYERNFTSVIVVTVIVSRPRPAVSSRYLSKVVSQKKYIFALQEDTEPFDAPLLRV